MKRGNFISIVFLFTAFLGLSGCSSNSKGILDYFIDGFTSGDGGEYDPIGDGSIFDPNDPNNPGERCENLDPVGSTIPSSHDFGLSEEGHRQCLEITIDPCLSANVEMDESSSDDFTLAVDGEDVDGRLTNQTGQFSICYKRDGITGLSSYAEGRVNVVINSSGSSVYANVITLKGQTVSALFNITTPVEGQLVWENSPDIVSYTTGSHFEIKGAGTVNLTELGSIIPSNTNGVIITAGGESFTVPYGADGSFSTSSVKILDAWAVYPVVFSLDTTQGLLNKTINVIRYGAPEGSLAIKDGNGNTLSFFDPDLYPQETTVSTLKLGVDISNVDVSAPSSHPLQIYLAITSETGVVQKYSSGDGWVSGSESVSPISYYAGFQESLDEEDTGYCNSYFENAGSSYCVDIKSVDLEKGKNTITATVCNEYTQAFSDIYTYGPEASTHGCTQFVSYLVLDNDKPVIEISYPKENQVLPEDTESVVVKGKIKNFKLNEPISGEDPKCLVELWLNTSPLVTLPTDVETLASIKLCDHLTIISGETGDPWSGDTGNIREAEFSVELDREDEWDPEVFNKANLFTNILRITAQDSNANTTIAVRSFQIGEISESQRSLDMSGGTSSLTSSVTAQLGSNSSIDGSTQRAPLMFAIPEKTLNGSSNSSEALIAVLEKMLNDNVKVKELLTGGSLGQQNNTGDCVVAGDGNGENCVKADLHGTSMAKYRALIELNYCNMLHLGYSTNEGVDLSNLVCSSYEGMYYGDGSNSIFFPPNKLADSCGNVQTAAFIFYDHLQYIWDGLMPMSQMYGEVPWPECRSDTDDCPSSEWPLAIAAKNPNFETTVIQGKWKINNIDFKTKTDNDGEKHQFIDINASLIGNDGQPAFFGHAVAYNLTVGGSSAQLDDEYQTNLEDPIMPIIINFDSLTLNFKEAIEIKKIKLNTNGQEPYCVDGDQVNSSDIEGAVPCNFECQNTTNCSNKLIIHEDKINLFEADGSVRSDADIQIEAYQECADLYRRIVYRQLDGDSSNDNQNIMEIDVPQSFSLPDDIQLPFGCEGDGFPTKPILIETNTTAGDLLYEGTSQEGTNPYLLDQSTKVLLQTFANTVSCLPNQSINPIFDAVAFPYPDYIPEDSKLDFSSISLLSGDDGLSVAFEEDPSSLFDLGLDLKDADILIDTELGQENAFLKVKLPLTGGVNGVNVTRTGIGTFNQTRGGHLYRKTVDGFDGDASDYPLTEIDNDPYFSGSLGLEEIVNALLYLGWERGPAGLLNDLAPGALSIMDVNGDYQLGLDKVTLGPDICDMDASPNLAPELFFKGISEELFLGYDSTHWDIIFNRNYSPTLALLPVKGDNPDDNEEYAMLQLGLTNIQVDVKNLEEITSANSAAKYKIGDSVVRIRLDGLLRIGLHYSRGDRRFEAYLDEDSPIYVSVVNGGGVYDDQLIVGQLQKDILYDLVIQGQNIGTKFRIDEVSTPTFAFTLPDSLTDFNNGLEIDVGIGGGGVTACAEGEAPQYYTGPDFSNMEMVAASSINLGSILAPAASSGPSISGAVLVNDFSVTTLPSSGGNSGPTISGVTPVNLPLDHCMGISSTLQPVSSLLCELGLKDIHFLDSYPNMELDYSNGYIHFSAHLGIGDDDVYDWLWEEVEIE